MTDSTAGEGAGLGPRLGVGREAEVYAWGGNVMVDGDRLSVIDWPNASRGVPEADHARAVLLLRWAGPDPGTPPVMRGLIAAGRVLLARGYARVYAADAGHPPRDVGSWLVVQIAARLSEGIEAERNRLVELLGRARSGNRAR